MEIKSMPDAIRLFEEYNENNKMIDLLKKPVRNACKISVPTILIDGSALEKVEFEVNPKYTAVTKSIFERYAAILTERNSIIEEEIKKM